MVADELERSTRPPSAKAAANPLELLVELGAVGGDLGRHVAERAPVAGEAEARALEPVDLVEPADELAHRVGRVAVVEEERDPAEQVVAGDQQPALGLVQDDVRGRVAGRLVHLPGAEVGLDLDPGDELAVGRRRVGRSRCSVPRRAS